MKIRTLEGDAPLSPKDEGGRMKADFAELGIVLVSRPSSSMVSEALSSVLGSRRRTDENEDEEEWMKPMRRFALGVSSDSSKFTVTYLPNDKSVRSGCFGRV